MVFRRNDSTLRWAGSVNYADGTRHDLLDPLAFDFPV